MTHCLACIPYFILNWNIFDVALTKTKLALVDTCLDLLETGERKEKARGLIKREICGLLNTTGGVILFDCERSYLRIIPRGEQLVIAEK